MRSLAVLALFVLIGCSKDWTDRELVPVSVNLGNGKIFSVSMPAGLKRTSAEGPLGIYESETTGDAPFLMLAALGASDGDADAFIAGTKDGSDFEKREVPNGFGVVYESGGPHVHVVRKIGATFFTCDASFAGGTKDRAKRLDLIWRICTSAK
jgi:hypothetical protein